MTSRRRRRSIALLGAAAMANMILSGAATAGPVADKAAEAEALLASGRTADALAAMEASIDALWEAAPFTIAEAFLVEDGSDTARRGDNSFRPGEALRIHVEPLGYGFAKADGQYGMAIETSVEIRTPGGLILAKSDALGRLEWTGPVPNRNFSGRVAIDLPELKPGDYEVILTLRDTAAGESATTTLPIIIAGDAGGAN